MAQITTFLIGFLLGVLQHFCFAVCIAKNGSGGHGLLFGLAIGLISLGFSFFMGWAAVFVACGLAAAAFVACRVSYLRWKSS